MEDKIRISFAVRLSLYIISCVVVIFLVVLIYNYQISKELILENNNDNIKNLRDSKLNQIDNFIIAAQKVPEDLSVFLEYSNQTESELLDMLRRVVDSNPEIYGSTISYEPYMFRKDKYYFAPYYYRSGDTVRYSDLGNEKYNYFKWDWYTEAKRLNKGVWGEPFYDEGGGNVLMVTYSQPFYKNFNGKRVFCGVVTCDIALDWFVELISKIKVFKTGYTFVLSGKGTFLAHPNKEYYRKGKSFFSIAKINHEPIHQKIGEDMINGRTGSERYYSFNTNQYSYVYYQPLATTGWSLGIVIHEGEILSKLDTISLKLFIIGIIGYVLTLSMIIFLSKRVTIPLRSLAAATHKIGNGDLQAVVPAIKSLDEIGLLSRSFKHMQENLIKYINNLQETTAAKEQFEKELSIAREIQQSILPSKFPLLKELSIYATLIPAKEVGGDLYDFFFIDNKHLCFAIGDVSGKGVSAALFMAIAKTLLRAKMNLYANPGEVLNAMNKDLFKENEPAMFVTFFLCVFNIETGDLQYCNAGHNPPLIHTANKGFDYFHIETPSPPIGIIEDAEYTTYKLKLYPEDIFFLYTDGITEAMNKDCVEYSEEKLLKVLDKNKDETVMNIINNVAASVEEHASGAVQSDDISMFAMKYNG